MTDVFGLSYGVYHGTATIEGQSPQPATYFNDERDNCWGFRYGEAPVRKHPFMKLRDFSTWYFRPHQLVVKSEDAWLIRGKDLIPDPSLDGKLIEFKVKEFKKTGYTPLE